MPNASYIQDSFAGGEKSQLAQGRITDREYRTWLNVCLNGHPTESGGWVRRSGTKHAGLTRGGKPGRIIKFDFAAATPYTTEFTDGFLRFRQGVGLAPTNDSQFIVAISAANPAVVQTTLAVTWVTGNTVVFGGAQPLLMNRQFTATRIDSTHFSLADAITGATIDGSTLGPLPAGAIIFRLQEVVTPYIGGNWATLRAVQAEANAVLLHGLVPPQILQVTQFPSPGNAAQFSLAGVVFLDGPYLDPFANGVQVTPNAVSGSIIFTLTFPAYVSSKAYKIGDFVDSAGINYESIIDNNVGNTPASSPSAWTAVSTAVAVNNGQGFLGTDIGRLVRFFSEPAPWSSGTTYTQGTVVSYNPTGAPGASTYWTSIVSSNLGNIPGIDTTHWQLATNAAIWSWGKITSLVPQISQGAGTPIGTLTQGGGLAAAFDGIIVQPAASSASLLQNVLGTVGFTTDAYVGKNFTGSPQQIASATVYGSSDFGTAFIQANAVTPSVLNSASCVFNLRAKATAPASPSDGTLLGTSGNVITSIQNNGANANSGAPITLFSNDQVTAWNYVWVETVLTFSASPNSLNWQVFLADAEVQFIGPSGTGSGNAIIVELLGPPLLYATTVNTWRLGVYSNTTGWPTCGTYHQGRLWLGGAIDNRFDASVSNGLVGVTLNMAPTDQNGVVGAANGISGTVNSDGVNPIFWFTPDLQGVIMGTQAGEWLISAPSPGAISPTNVDANRVTRIGCANVEPRKTDHTNVFVQRYSRKVMEYFTDVYSGKFSAPNLAKDALHITKPLVAELAWTQAVVPIIWGRNVDGSWWGTTYKRDTLATAVGPTANGWHRHQLGSGRSVVSIAAGPSTGGNLDALTMVTLDLATSIYHVEVMTDTVDEGNTLVQATYLDDAVNPTSVTSSNVTPAPDGGLTINGLWHLNGKKVTAWLGGLDCGDYTVSNGSITVPYGDGISAGTANGLFSSVYAGTLTTQQMLVGFTFTSQGQIVRPATPQESGARNGPAVGKKRRNHKIAAQLEGTGVGVSFGTVFTKLDPAKFRQLNDVAFLVNQQFTGVYKDTLTDGFGYSYDGMMCWQVTRPYPCNIANIGGFVETMDE